MSLLVRFAFFIFTAAAGVSLVSSGSAGPPESSSLSSISRTPSDSLEWLDELRSIILFDRRDYDHRVELAEYLSKSNEIEVRREAYRVLHEAMLIDDSDPEIWVRMARLQERRGFRRESREAYNRALGMAPDRADVWSELSQHEFRRFQKTKRGEFYSRALFANARALRADPDNPSALRIAVRMAYISAKPVVTDTLCARWEVTDPQNPWPNMVRGLLFAENGAWERAMDAFQTGLTKMSEQQRKPFVRLTLVSPRMEERRREAAPDTMRFFNDYWRWRDPTPADDVNERLIEHYRRMVQAELLFALDHLNLRGWDHDPGGMIVRYGLPDGWTYGRDVIRGPEERMSASSGFAATSIRVAYGQVPPAILLRFVDYNLSGRYITPINPFASDEDFFFVANPALYEALLGVPELGMETEVWRFVDPSGEGRIEVAVALPPDWWPRTFLQYPHRLATKLTVYDEFWERVDGMVGSWASFERDPLGRLIGTFEMTGSPDSVVIALETEDRNQMAHAGEMLALSPMPMRGDGPVISDLAFLSAVSFENSGGQYGRWFGEGLPNPGHRYLVSDPVGIAFEVYGLEASKGSCRTRIHVTVGRQTKKGIFNVLLGRAGDTPEAELVFDAGEPGNRLRQLLSIDVPPLDPGRYVLTLRVDDLETGETTELSDVFTVLEPGELR